MESYQRSSEYKAALISRFWHEYNKTPEAENMRQTSTVLNLESFLDSKNINVQRNARTHLIALAGWAAVRGFFDLSDIARLLAENLNRNKRDK